MGIYYYAGMPYDSDYLQHHGILGQKWGIRRFQNPDGTLTEAGKKRYAKEVSTYLSENSRDMERDRSGTYAVKLSTGNETVYNELVRSSKALKDSADNLRDKELEYDRVSMMYDKDDSLRKEFEDEVRKDEYYSKQIEEAIKKGASEDDVQEYISDVALENYITSDHPSLQREYKARKDVNEAMKQLKDDTLKYASDFLGVYGDLPAKSIKTGEDSTVKDLFADLSYKKAINASYHDYWINKSNGRR